MNRKDYAPINKNNFLNSNGFYIAETLVFDNSRCKVVFRFDHVNTSFSYIITYKHDGSMIACQSLAEVIKHINQGM